MCRPLEGYDRGRVLGVRAPFERALVVLAPGFVIGVATCMDKLTLFIAVERDRVGGVSVLAALQTGEGSGVKSGISSGISSGVAQGEWWGVDPLTPLMSMGSSTAREVGKKEE